MKRFVLAFSLAASLCTVNNTYAKDGITAPSDVLRSFQTTFGNAKNAGWSQAADLYKVSFCMDGQYATAFYNADGTLHAITRNISVFALPIGLQTSLKNEYKAFWVAGLFELSNDSGVQYYLTLEDADNKVILKSVAGSWSIYQKARK